MADKQKEKFLSTHFDNLENVNMRVKIIFLKSVITQLELHFYLEMMSGIYLCTLIILDYHKNFA